MESSVSSQGDVNLSFVIPCGQTEETCSALLICAYQACKDHDLSPIWLSSEKCLQLQPTKQDVFIIDPFDGEAFDYIKSGFKSVRVLGPRCLLTCLHRKEPVPELPFPIHNTAMKGLVITSTGFDREEKAELQSYVELMAGIYSNNFHEGVTHLVAKCVSTKKYYVAVQKDMAIMTGQWVKAVWNEVMNIYKEDFFATDEQFLSYTCPPFLGLVICVSQLPRKDKEILRKYIEDNGGIYAPNLERNVTSVVIIPSPDGEKYDFATEWQIPCVTPDWIKDSVDDGHALDKQGYMVEPKCLRGASTPCKVNDNSLPEISTVSTIANESMVATVSHVNETVDESSVIMKKTLPYFEERFEGMHIEKLRRILNAGGATRFNLLTESVSHVVVGKYIEEQLHPIDSWPSKPFIVTAEWIKESLHERKPAHESLFYFFPQKNTSFVRPKVFAAASVNETETFIDDAMVNQYLSGECKKMGLNDSTLNESSLPETQQLTMKHKGLFTGKLFTLSGYADDIQDELIDLICEKGGEVAPLDYEGLVDYSVVTVQGTGTLHPNAKECVSHAYIEDCLDNEELLLVEYYHLPIVLNQLCVLENCVIATSTYKGKERPFLMLLATVMGAVFQEVFAKKDNPSKNVKGCTHLVCPATDGDKFKAALKWGIPAVTRDWIITCAIQECRVPEDSFLVTESVKHISNYDIKKFFLQKFKEKININRELEKDASYAAFDKDDVIWPTPVNNRVQSLRSQLLEENYVKTPDMETIRKMYPTPGRNLSNDSLSNIPTPETPYGSTWFPNPSSRIRKLYKRTLDLMPDDPINVKRKAPDTPEEVYIERFFENVRKTIADHDQIPRTTGTDTANGNKLSSISAEPLKGVVVYVSQKLYDQQKELCAMVSDLGGEFRWTYDGSVTHYVFQGKENDIRKEFRLARQSGKKIISPEWVKMCFQEKSWIDESLFPHTHNPKLSLSIVTCTPLSRNKKVSTNSNKKKIVNEEIKSQSDDDVNNEILSKQLEEIEALATASVERVKTTYMKRSFSERLNTGSPVIIQETHSAPVEGTESQNTAVTWEDPDDKEAKFKLKNQMSKTTQEILDAQKLNADEEVQGDNLPRRIQASDPTSFVFAFSGFTDEDKQYYVDIVEHLGGIISNSPNFDALWTHIISLKPNRSEKHLASIASGKWILFKSYLDDSLEKCHFVSEELHEWGNPRAISLPTFDEDRIESKLAAAAYRWRCKRSLHEGIEATLPFGAFCGMKAIVHTSPERISSFTRLIHAGGGTVFPIRPPYSNIDEDEVTHCFVELNRAGKFDLAVFAAKMIPCVPPVFLNDYLVNDPPPTEMENCIDEYNEVLVNMSQIGNNSVRKNGR